METIPPAASDCLGVRARSVFRRRSIDAYISKETQGTMETIPPDCLGLVFEYAQFFLRCAISANRRNPVPSILGAHRRRVFAWRCGQRCSRTAGRSSLCMCVEACHQDYLQAAVAFLVGNLHLSNLSIRQKHRGGELVIKYLRGRPTYVIATGVTVVTKTIIANISLLCRC